MSVHPRGWSSWGPGKKAAWTRKNNLEKKQKPKKLKLKPGKGKVKQTGVIFRKKDGRTVPINAKKSSRNSRQVGRATNRATNRKVAKLMVAPKMLATGVAVNASILKKYGYAHNLDPKERRSSLTKAVYVEGYENVRRLMQELATSTRNSKLQNDLAFVEGMKAERQKRWREILARVSEKPKDRKILQKVNSASRPGTVYYISQGPKGGLTCSCPSFIFSRSKPKSCKHMKAYLAENKI